MTEALLDVARVAKSFGGVAALSDTSFTVAAGEIVAVIGANGAGKTTLFNVINGQLTPDRGRVRLANEDITGLPPRMLARRGVGRTFQIAATFTSMVVYENVRLALLAREGKAGSLLSSASYRRDPNVLGLLERVGIEDLAHRHCATLPYADLKRVELAIALASRPRLLLMDEPTAGMASAERAHLMALVAAIARDDRVAVLFTEHDMDIVFTHAARVLVLDRGSLIASGSSEAVRADPRVRAVYLGEDGAGDANTGNHRRNA